MARTLLPSSGILHGTQQTALHLDEVEDDEFDLRALPTQPSTAKADEERDEARMIRLRENHPKALAIKLADRLNTRLGLVWQMVDPFAVSWQPDYEEFQEPDGEMHKLRRVLLFHISAMVDVNECSLAFLDCSESAKRDYFKLLHSAVVRKAVELNGSLQSNISQLEVIFSMLHGEMLKHFEENGRKESGAALIYWKECNEKRGMISPVPFNMIARAALSKQASSAPAERLFSDLGRKEGNQSQSLLSSTLEMKEMIRAFVGNEIRDIRLGQNGLLHPKAQAFRRTVERVAREIRKSIM